MGQWAESALQVTVDIAVGVYLTVATGYRKMRGRY